MKSKSDKKMITLEGIRIGTTWYEYPVPRDEQGQIQTNFSEGKSRLQLQGLKIPSIRDYLTLFALHSERPDQDITNLVNDIEEQPLEWANNALLREGTMLYDVSDPRVTDEGRIIIPRTLYSSPRAILPRDKAVLTVADLGDIAKNWFGKPLAEIPQSLREIIITPPRSGTAGLVRVGRMGKGYCVTSTMPGVYGVARGVSYE